MNKKGQDDLASMMVIGFFVLLGIALVVGGIYLFHSFEPWWMGISGEAELRNAEYSKQVAVQEAKAKLESSTLLAQAEVERAKGVAQANAIIGDSLKNNDAYLRYLWIQGMQTNQMQVVYVPTEGNLPILEAERFSQYDK